MLSFVFESAARSLALALAVGAAMWLLRIRTPRNRSLAWTAVLVAAMTMPALVKAMRAALDSAPAAAAWIRLPAAPFLRPLTAAAPSSPTASIDWLRVASIVYLLVAGALLVRLLAGLLRSRRLRSDASPLNEPWTQGWDIRLSKDIAIPVTSGSTILLPPAWTGWNDFALNAVLLHEQSHVRRRDSHVQALAGFHRAVFWFSPLSWWLQNHLLELTEAAADDEAVGRVQDRVSYAEILIDFARRRSESGFAGVAMARGRTVERRVERLLQEACVPAEASRFRRVLLGALFVPLVGASSSAWLAPGEGAGAPLALTLMRLQQIVPAPQPVEPGQYLANWVEQEVPDIASDEERAAFHALRTDEERERFIAAFWRRRDPTPGADGNEFRDEYFRRIAAANQRFGLRTGTPGWRTDRGRILIMHGEPTELETYAQQDATPQAGFENLPYELWRYRYIEGVGRNVILKFVDVSRDGDYRLQSQATTYDVIRPNQRGETRGGARGR